MKTRRRMARGAIVAGLSGGMLGGLCIWVYEALVWSGVQHLLPLAGIPRNAVGLAFGNRTRDALGWMAYPLGTLIHFVCAAAWGMAFAAIWPWFKRRGWEATLLALPFAVVVWVVMHAAITLAGHEHPDYRDATVIIGGIMSHLFYAIPLALIVKHFPTALEPFDRS